MSTKIEDGGYAFPSTVRHWNDHLDPDQKGMSLRDWFAGQALAGMASIALEDGDMPMGWGDMGKASYNAADAMLKARTKERQP